MELSTTLRNNMVAAIQAQINTGTPGIAGSLEFYDNTGPNQAPLVTIALAAPCMTIEGGVGSFASPLVGTVPAGRGGVANRWAIKNNAGTVIMTGTCGDANSTTKDIVFNSLTWNDYDNVNISGLTITIPAGANDYLA